MRWFALRSFGLVRSGARPCAKSAGQAVAASAKAGRRPGRLISRARTRTRRDTGKERGMRLRRSLEADPDPTGARRGIAPANAARSAQRALLGAVEWSHVSIRRSRRTAAADGPRTGPRAADPGAAGIGCRCGQDGRDQDRESENRTGEKRNHRTGTTLTRRHDVDRTARTSYLEPSKARNSGLPLTVRVARMRESCGMLGRCCSRIMASCDRIALVCLFECLLNCGCAADQGTRGIRRSGPRSGCDAVGAARSGAARAAGPL